MARARDSRHICLIAKGNSTVEHLAVLARQAEAEDLETCWLDLGHEPTIAHEVKKYSGRDTTPVHSKWSLRRHFSKHHPVAVWLHTPYPEHYPAWFWVAVRDQPLAYSPYSSGFPTNGWEEGQYALATFKKCTWLLATHDGMRDGYLRHGVPAERILLTGGPMMYEVQHPLSLPAENNDVLWAPHWIEDYFGRGSFSTWRWMTPVMYEFALAHPETKIVVRPHPFLQSAIDSAGPDDVEAIIYRRLTSLPNVTTSERALVDDILASGALISEGTSLNIYFATTGKPLGTTRGTVTDLPEDYYILLDASDDLPSPEEAAAWLEKLPTLTNSPERIEVIGRLLPTFDRSPVAMWNEHRLNEVKVRRK